MKLSMNADQRRFNFDFFADTLRLENFRVLASSRFIFFVQLIAFWSAWQWLTARVWSSDEEIWGIFAIAAAVFFCFFRSENVSVKLSTFSLYSSAIFTILYAASFAYAPPLARSALAMTALTLTLSGWRFNRKFHAGIFTLLLLGLPVMASFNFFLGYPLRVIVGEAVEFLLKLQGLEVWREGVGLHFGEKLIWIDAPCSGVKMLWFGIFLTAVLITFFRFNILKSITALIIAFAAILLGNVFRASALFYTEAEIFQIPAWMHEAIGVFAFLLTALGIVFIVTKLNDLKWQK